jgi:hypothetical protein
MTKKLQESAAHERVLDALSLDAFSSNADLHAVVDCTFDGDEHLEPCRRRGPHSIKNKSDWRVERRRRRAHLAGREGVEGDRTEAEAGPRADGRELAVDGLGLSAERCGAVQRTVKIAREHFFGGVLEEVDVVGGGRA